MLFQTQSNVLFRLFRLLTAQVGSNLVIICTNSLDCYKLHSGFDRRTRNAIINIFTHECPRRNTLDFLAVMLNLILNRRRLLQRLCGNTAIGYNSKRNISNRFMLKHFFHFIKAEFASNTTLNLKDVQMCQNML